MIIITILSILTIIGDISLVAYVFFLVFMRKKTQVLVKKHGLWLAFLVALTATLGSLYFSEILGYEPCRLCWFQRILMYPQVLLLGLALSYRDRKIGRYVVPLSVIGACISIYHYVIQRTGPLVCNVGVPCTSQYTFNYGYITIPMMALTAFLMIIASQGSIWRLS